MARFVASGLFVWAAFNWQAWILDRSGLALLAAAFLALSVGRKARRPWARTLPPPGPAFSVDGSGAPDLSVDDLRALVDGNTSGLAAYFGGAAAAPTEDRD